MHYSRLDLLRLHPHRTHDLGTLLLRDSDVDHLALVLPHRVGDDVAILLVDGRAHFVEPGVNVIKN